MTIAELTAQRNTVGAGQLSTVTFTYPGTPTPGNLLVAGFAWRGNVTVTAVPSGWILAASTADGNNIDGAIYYKIAGSSEPTTAQWTLSGSQKSAGVASEWSGIHVTPIDAQNGNTGVATTTLNTGATGVLSQADELVINMFSARDAVSFTAFGEGQTTSGTAQSTGGTTASRNTTVLVSKVVSSTSSVDYTAQIDSAQTWVAAVATFKQGAVTHSATGSLSGQGASIVGTSAHKARHDASGTLSGQGSDIDGAATRFRQFSASGDLPGQSASIVASAARSDGAVTHDVSGDLSGQGSLISGVSGRYRQFDASGNLIASGSNISGDVNRYRAHNTAAALVGQGSSLDGSAIRYRSHDVDGSLIGQGSTLNGDAARSDVVVIHNATGELVGAGSAIAGLAKNGELVISGTISTAYVIQTVSAELINNEISATYRTHTIIGTI